MTLKYVIGTYDSSNTNSRTQCSDNRTAEHMEEDEDSPDSIPPWVKLEYAVSRKPRLHNVITFSQICLLEAYENLGGTGC